MYVLLILNYICRNLSPHTEILAYLYNGWSGERFLRCLYFVTSLILDHVVI